MFEPPETSVRQRHSERPAWNSIALHVLINMLYVVNPAPFIVVGIKTKWALLRRQEFISACV